jgi:hypothetical protein
VFSGFEWDHFLVELRARIPTEVLERHVSNALVEWGTPFSGWDPGCANLNSLKVRCPAHTLGIYWNSTCEINAVHLYTCSLQVLATGGPNWRNRCDIM